MAEFTADLNPKKSSMDLGDLMKMDEAMAKRKLYSDAIKAKTPVKAPVPAPNNMVKSDATDPGVPFKFGNNYQSDEE